MSEALNHRDPEVRVRALRAMASLSQTRAAHLVPPMLHDVDPRVRATAAAIAGELRIEAAVFSLILGLDDQSAKARRACFDAIARITGRPPWGDEPDEATRRAKVAELREWWKQERTSGLARQVRANQLTR